MQATAKNSLALATAVLVAFSATVRASETDDRIDSSFAASFVYRTYLKDENIAFRSNDGAVSLSGKVFNEGHKTLALDVAEALPGVRSVDNRIEITGDGPAKMSDAWIGMNVKHMLMYHRNVSADKTDVDVKDGNVTLKGEVASLAHKQLTGDYAKYADGVKTVDNAMTVGTVAAMPRKTVDELFDDASITALVKAVLLSYRTASVLNTTVTTNEGVVTLGGEAASPDEKTLLAQLVVQIHGVKSVSNNMTARENALKNSNQDFIGFVGSAGPEGTAGPAGAEGAIGAAGAPGAGVAGLVGEKGPSGAAGIQGATGARGEAGDVEVGPPGAIGPAGPAGARGARGETGAQGASKVGTAGSVGRTGPQGAQGISGETGAKGPTLVGPTGPAGRAGPAGAPGAVGQRGAQGASGVGVAGAAGAVGAAGPQGKPGAPGARGPVGGVEGWSSYRAFWFESTTADLRSADMSQVAEIADYLKKNPSVKVGLDASSPSGSTTQGQKFGARRVTAVREALIEAGVATSRIETGALGDPQLARDQRVEVLLRTGD